MIATFTRVTATTYPESFERLFREHSAFVYRTAYRVTGSVEDAEDVLQTLFVQLLRRDLPPDFEKNPKAYPTVPSSSPPARLRMIAESIACLAWPPGEYYVGVGAVGTLAKTDAAAGIFRYFTWSATPGQVVSTQDQTFFPSAASLGEAAPVMLREGEEIGGIDIVMRPVLPSDAPVRPSFIRK